MLKFKNWIISEGYDYSCVMADFDFDKLINWAKKNIPEDCLYYKENKDGYETDPHVTVLYGLHTVDPNDVKELLKNQKPFEIKLGKISIFDTNPDYDVLKIEVESDILRKLNDKLKDLPYTNSFKSYKPHCTIAYIKKDKCKDLIGNKTFYGKKFKIKELTFSGRDNKKTKISL